jgi:integrase
MDLQPNQLWLRLRVAKTIQFGGEPHVLGLVATNCAICPVRAVREHLALTTNVGPKAHLFITKPVGPKGAAAVPLSHAALVSGIRKLLTAIGMDPLKFSGHSLRRGGATLAYDLGISEMAI